MKEYCRICLAVDVGMDKFRNTEKRNFIGRIFKYHGHYRLLNEQHSVCYICEALLTKSYAFIERALRAQQVLNDLLKKNNSFTAVNMLVDLDRRKYKLNYAELSYKKINIGSIDESEVWSVKEEMDTDDNDITNDNLNCELNDTLNVDINNTESVTLDNMLTDSRTNEKNKDFTEFEIKLEEPRIDIALIQNNNPLVVMTEGNNNTSVGIVTEINNPLDMTEGNNTIDSMTEEKNPLDMTEGNNTIDSMTEEKNPLDMTEGNNTIDSMTEENNHLDMTEGNKPIDIMTEENNSLKNMYKSNDECYNEIDDLFDFQCNDTDRVEMDETNITELQADKETKKKSLPNNNINKTTHIVTQEVHEIIIDSDMMDPKQFDTIKNKKKMEKKDISKKQDLETINREVCEKIKLKNRKRILMKRKESMGSGNNKSKTKYIRRPYNEQQYPKCIIKQVKKQGKMAKITYTESDISDEEESEIKKGRFKRKKSSDNEYVPDSCKSSDSECEREYPMTCEQCDSVLSSKTEHFHHYMEMHPKIKYPYGDTKLISICEICGARFYRKDHFTMHLRTHGAKTEQCKQCPKMFHTAYQLLQHVARVHAPRKIECDYCQKRFPNKSSVKLHIRTHTKEKPFKCHICNAGFAHGGNRLLHIRVKHQNLPYPLQEKQNKEKLNKKKKRETKNKTNMSGNPDDTVVKRKTIKRKIKKRKSRKQCPSSDSD